MNFQMNPNLTIGTPEPPPAPQRPPLSRAKKNLLFLLALIALTLLGLNIIPTLFIKKDGLYASKYEVARMEIQTKLDLFYLRHGHYPVVNAPLTEWLKLGQNYLYYFPKGIPAKTPYNRPWKVTADGKVK
jgi:hypothetical protein